MAGNDTAYAPGPRQTGVMCQPGWCRPRDFPPAGPGGAYSIASTQAAPGFAPQMGWKERRPSISDGRGESLGLAFPVGTGRPRVVTWEVSRPLSRCSSCPWSVSVCVAGDFKSFVQRCLDGGFGSTATDRGWGLPVSAHEPLPWGEPTTLAKVRPSATLRPAALAEWVPRAGH